MEAKRAVEIFSAGCPVCKMAIEKVRSMACPSCEITVLDMHDPNVTARANALGIRSVPTVVVDGKVAECCAGRGIDEAILKAAGVGVPIAPSMA